MAEVTIRALPACARFVLRCAPEVAATLIGFGVALPQLLLHAEANGEDAALRLGPKEWLLLAPAGTPAPWPGLLVEVSDGDVGFLLHGAAAAQVLNEGCPLDLALPAFPVGACTRTIFAKAQILLWRQGEAQWHVGVARSFAPYLLGLLQAAASDLEDPA